MRKIVETGRERGSGKGEKKSCTSPLEKHASLHQGEKLAVTD